METPTVSGKSNYIVKAFLEVSKKDTLVLGDGTYSDAVSNKATGTASISDENAYHVQADSESGEYVSAFARQSKGIIEVYAQSGFKPKRDDGAGTVKEEDVKKTPIQAHRQIRERMVTKIEPVQTLTSSSKAISTQNKFAAIADLDGKGVVDINDKGQDRKKTQYCHVKEHLTTKIDQTKSLASSSKLISTRTNLLLQMKSNWIRELSFKGQPMCMRKMILMMRILMTRKQRPPYTGAISFDCK